MEIIILAVIAVVMFVLIFWGYMTLASQQKAKVDKEDKKRYFSLESANSLYYEQKYDLAVIDAYKSLEIALKKKFPNVQTEKGTSFELISYAQQKGYLNKSQVDKAHYARIERNKVVHDRGQINSDTAIQVLSAVRQVIEGLGY
jgi:hypothetical protein